MVRRHARHGTGRRPRRFAVFSLAMLAVLGAAAWMAPTIAVLTSLRNRPLEAALEGIAGSVSCGSARWAWLGPVSFHDVVVHDPAGQAIVFVPELVIDRGLVGLALSPRDLGTIRLVGPEAVVEVRPGGSSLEDLLAPWLAKTPSAAPPACAVEVIDGVLEVVDAPRGDAWRLVGLFAAVTLDAAGTAADWSVGGRLQHAGRPTAPSAALPATLPAAPAARRIERATVAAGTAAALARDGGFSLTAAAGAADEPRRVTVAAHRLPLGASSVAATRYGAGHVADGLAEVRLDVAIGSDASRIAGSLAAEGLAICAADTLTERITIDSLEVPVELSVRDGRVTVTKLSAVSKLFRAEASGRLRLPDATPSDWLDALAADDFAVAADVDLAAVARSLAGGLTVRDDVRVTNGHLEVAAAARADGDERLLEVRAAARDLAAEQKVVDAATGAATDRPLRWTEPFAAWLKARRSPTGGLRIDEARITSGPLEVTAAGSATSAEAQWSLDLDAFVAEAAEVIDLAGVDLAGKSRGRITITRPAATGPARLTLAADLEDFELAVPGRPTWRDDEVVIEAEATGGVAAGTAVVESAHAVMTGGDDRFSVTLTGGAVVDLASLAGGVPAVRPAPSGAATATDLELTGDLGRWHARLAPLLPAGGAGGLELAGRVKAAVAAVARGDAWEITRATAEVERLAVNAGGRRIAEPRLIASAAGVVRPAAGRIDLASAEVLTATVSLRTAGLAWRPTLPDSGAGWRHRLRGTVQWQADAGRLERWLVDPETSSRWPVTGRAWGTVALVDGVDGLDVVVEATGNQLALAEIVAAAPAPPRPVWSEPQATLAVEVAVPQTADGALTIAKLAVESSTLAIQARGTVGGSPRSVELDGTTAYDWQQVSRLLAPWTGGSVQLAGAGGRPFALRGRLADVAASPSPPPVGDTAALPLPADWVTASQAGAEARRVTVPVSTAPSRVSAAAILRSLAVDTSFAWQAGEVAGFRLEPGEIPVRLLEGQLAFGPFDVGVAGGRVRGAPWVGLAAAPRELVVPPARIVDRVSVDGPPARRLVSWLSPLVGHAAHATGMVSVDLAGARLPLADAFGGLADGQVVFEALEVTPGPALMPLAAVLAKLQSLVDPRLAFGDKPVLMRVRPDPVRVRLVERRLWHEGLVLDAGQMTVKSGGSVGADGTLAMVVEVALRAEVAGQTPVVAQLLRTPLVIPLKGTVERPQFDARAIDTMLAKIVENTAQAVIGDGIVRGLDALLGGPQPAPPPAPAPAPLVVPPRP